MSPSTPELFGTPCALRPPTIAHGQLQTQSAAGVHIETCRGVAFDMTSQSMIESSSALWFGEHLPTPPPDTLSAAPTTHTLYLHYA